MSATRSWDRPFGSHVEFYEHAYRQHIESVSAIGSIGAVAIEAHQSAGDWSDAPTPDLAIGWLPSRPVGISIDLGAGRFSGRLRTGEGILIAPGAGAAIVMEGAHVCRVIAVPYAALAEFTGADLLPADGDFGPLHKTLLRDAELGRVRDALWAEARRPARADGTLMADGLMVQLAAQLLRLRGGGPGGVRAMKGGLATWQERRATEYLASHLAGDVTLDTLADVAGLSTFHFARQFKQSTGLPPHAYLRRLRCEKAKELLAGTTLPVTEIAAQVGYETPQAFARMFRAEVGASPSQYRRQRRS